VALKNSYLIISACITSKYNYNGSMLSDNRSCILINDQ